MKIKGLVIKSVGGLFTVKCYDENSTIIETHAKGAFKHKNIKLLCGDEVEIDVDNHNEYYISKVFERKNYLIRPPVSNIDIAFAVIPCVEPKPSFETIDKFVCICESKKIEPVIVITKSDLDKQFSEDVYDIYSKAGYKTFITSSYNQDGINSLIDYILDISKEEKKVFVFSGASGAGKSTLINSIFPGLQLDTGELSYKIQRGKNTTRKTEFFYISDLLNVESKGYIVDTPGFSLLDLEKFDLLSFDDLFYTFREFESSIGKCRYKKCTHTKEDGCDILRRISSGEISKSRHDSYVSFFNILKNKHTWNKN